MPNCLFHQLIIMNSLTNKVAYITGGSKGIGLGIAKKLLEQNMRIAISGRNMATVQEAAGGLGTDDSQVLAIQSDVRSAASELEAVRKTVTHFGSLDVVIANAGVGHFA